MENRALNPASDGTMPSGDRKVINVYAHGGIGGASVGTRYGDNLNVSGVRYDQHFDSQRSHDLSLDHYSSRQHYGAGHGGAGADIRDSIGNLKRSETETLINQKMIGGQGQSVHFAQNVANKGGNHPLHYRNDILERIEENKSPVQRGKSGSKASTVGAVVNQRMLHENKQLGGSKHSNINDVSQLTINSNRLDESVKAPGRPPQRVRGLTQYLVDLHYKKFGVYTKSGLFEFWKENVSVIYRRLRQSQILKGAVEEPMFNERELDRSIKGAQVSFKKKEVAHTTSLKQKKRSRSSSPKKHNEDLPPYEENVNFETLQLIDYSRLYEMDVAYTIQVDLDEENDEAKKLIFLKEQELKQAYEKKVRDEELSYVKWAIEAYYIEVKDYFMSIDDYKYDKQDDYFKQWHQRTADWVISQHNHNLNASTRPGTTATLNSTKHGQENKEPNVKEAEDKKDVEEISKKAKDLADREKILKDQIKDESVLLLNLMTMLRDQKIYTNDPSQMSRNYLDCSDKQRHGIIFGSDDKAQKVIRNFFKAERVFKRLQILYYAKIQKEKRYKHLSLFGFYKQLSKHQRILHFIDWPVTDSKELVVAKIDESDPHKQYEWLAKKLVHDEDLEKGVLSIEELCVRFETFLKLKLRFIQDETMKQMSKTQHKERERLLESVFGKEKKKKIEKEFKELKSKDHLKILAKPKDKWKRLKILMSLKKKFQHDMVLEKMIKEELKSNKVFKYPEEYDLYDEQEDKLCKHQGEKGIQVKELSAGKSIREKFKALDDQDLYYLKQEIQKKRIEEARMQKFLVHEAVKYLDQKKKRLQGKQTTVRMFVSDVYHKLVKDFPKIAEERFPHVTYGTKKDSETYKKSFPHTFKNYFFHLVKSHFKREQKLKRMRNPAPTFILAAGKRCIYHENMTCPEGCPHATFNKKVTLKHAVIQKYMKEPQTFRSRVWRRNDFRKALEKVLMTNEEIENCTFEPEAGSMSLTIEQMLKANPNLRKDGILDEPDPEAYVKKLGQNFDKSHPEVYKAGVLKRAQLMYKDGKFDDALKRLYDGFNVDSIRKRFDPKYMKRLIIEQSLKKISLGRSASANKESTSPGSALKRIAALKDEPDSQKKKPEEDFENKKLLPILKQAFDLINTIEDRKTQTENRIKKIERDQHRLRKSLTQFSSYKRSQTRVDLSKDEKILFRTIMCPLRDKCPKDMRPRWPTSNTKSVKKFGEECPFAHHQMELKFPESIITKLSSTRNTIKNLRGQLDSEKPKEVFKPSGPLHECSGCNSKSSKHIGGPCNLCRYKEMANLSSAKFSDKEKAKKFRRSLSKRETKDEREDQKEMHEIMKLLNLDQNFTIKFGRLKKACVLFFYGRYNDAFDEVAKAAKIIQEQREIEKQKQQVIEKRWKFKLGLDDGFEFPMPIDQIDPAKVDEKFLKKLDLQGVAVSTLKLYIEQVAPQAREEYSKHAFLNKCIEDFYLQCEQMLDDKLNTIKKMKKQVEKLDEDADMLEAFGSSPERSPDKGMPGERKVKPGKTKRCPNLDNKGGCSLPSWKCPYAHNPIELDLIPIETKMKNLQGVIQSQTQKLKNMKPLEPWKPVKSGEVIHTHLMDMSSKGKKRKGQEGDDEEDDNRRKEVKRKSIFDRENIFRKPYEQNE